MQIMTQHIIHKNVTALFPKNHVFLSFSESVSDKTLQEFFSLLEMLLLLIVWKKKCFRANVGFWQSLRTFMPAGYCILRGLCLLLYFVVNHNTDTFLPNLLLEFKDKIRIKTLP